MEGFWLCDKCLSRAVILQMDKELCYKNLILSDLSPTPHLMHFNEFQKRIMLTRIRIHDKGVSRNLGF
jgi:hypothetical protein